MAKKSIRAKACDIPAAVKRAVWERDHGRCVVCGNTYNVMPNAHFIARSHGGLGIEKNIVTLCTNLTVNQCHYKFDNGSAVERAEIGDIIRRYLKSKYPDWDEKDLYFRR